METDLYHLRKISQCLIPLVSMIEKYRKLLFLAKEILIRRHLKKCFYPQLCLQPCIFLFLHF